MLRGLLEAVHGITRAKVGGAQDPAQSAEEREAYAEWAAKLGHAAIHRLWQLLLKGLAEVHAAPMPLEAAEMALLRVIHAAELPDPGAVLEKLASGEAVAAPRAPRRPKAESQGALLQGAGDFAGLVEKLGRRARRISRPAAARFRRPGPLRAAGAGRPAARSRCRAISPASVARRAEGR